MGAGNTGECGSQRVYYLIVLNRLVPGFPETARSYPLLSLIAGTHTSLRSVPTLLTMGACPYFLPIHENHSGSRSASSTGPGYPSCTTQVTPISTMDGTRMFQSLTQRVLPASSESAVKLSPSYSAIRTTLSHWRVFTTFEASKS